jgi:predicted transcriptional regulator
MNTNNGFSVLLYCNFIIKKKYGVDAVSQKMGIAKDTLYKYVNGSHVFPAEKLIDLTNATEDMEYLEYIADKCNRTVITKIKDKKTAEAMIEMAKLFLSATAGREEGK